MISSDRCNEGNDMIFVCWYLMTAFDCVIPGDNGPKILRHFNLGNNCPIWSRFIFARSRNPYKKHAHGPDRTSEPKTDNSKSRILAALMKCNTTRDNIWIWQFIVTFHKWYFITPTVLHYNRLVSHNSILGLLWQVMGKFVTRRLASLLANLQNEIRYKLKKFSTLHVKSASTDCSNVVVRYMMKGQARMFP